MKTLCTLTLMAFPFVSFAQPSFVCPKGWTCIPDTVIACPIGYTCTKNEVSSPKSVKTVTTKSVETSPENIARINLEKSSTNKTYPTSPYRPCTTDNIGYGNPPCVFPQPYTPIFKDCPLGNLQGTNSNVWTCTPPPCPGKMSWSQLNLLKGYYECQNG